MVTDGPRSYGATLKDMSADNCQVTDSSEDNRAENSRHHSRGRQRAIKLFRRLQSFQKFCTVYSLVCVHFISDRSLLSRPVYKAARTASLAEWWVLCGN